MHINCAAPLLLTRTLLPLSLLPLCFNYQLPTTAAAHYIIPAQAEGARGLAKGLAANATLSKLVLVSVLCIDY